MNINKIKSPRVENLIREIENNSTKAIDCFWESIEKEGTPIIESIEDDADNVLITFLYKSDKGIDNIVIYGAFPGYRYEENLMEQISNTNIWFKTYKLRNDVKFKYSFSLNYTFDKDYENIKKQSLIDPLNQKKVVFIKDGEDPESEEEISSLVIMNNVKPEIWTKRTGSKTKGKLELHRFYSNIMNTTRRIWVYTPYGYSEVNEKCDLVVLTDGFDHINYLSAEAVLDNLISANKISPTVCVFIDNAFNRFEELTCNEELSRFIASELILWVYDNYNVTNRPSKTTIGGFSLGGLASAYIGLNHSNIFGNVVAQSSSFWWEEEWLIKEFSNHEKLPLKFYLNAGYFEGRPYDTEPIMMEVISKMREVLLSKGYEVIYEQFQSGHDYLSWGEGLANGLIAISEEM
jgi:enterochelin esterase family protein